MHSTDPVPASGGAVAQDKYLAPGEWAHFVFHLSVCHKDVMVSATYADQPIAAKVTSTLADGVPAPDATNGLIPKKAIFLGKYPNLDRMAAIQSFVDVLRYPEASRFESAEAQLSLVTLSPGPELTALLALHPGFPKP
jgi:hypothetical protein